MKRWLFFLLASLLLFASCQRVPDYLFVVSEEENSRQEEAAETEVEVTVTETNTFETDPPVSITDPEETETPSETQPNGITLLSLTETVKRGNQATVTVKGTPGMTYTITVHYATTISQASGLEPKMAGEDGTVSWTWRVGSRTNEGTHKIEIAGGDYTLTLTFTTTA